MSLYIYIYHFTCIHTHTHTNNYIKNNDKKNIKKKKADLQQIC
jgi:hypothetical protein